MLLRKLYPYLPDKYVSASWVPLAAIVALLTVALTFAHSGQGQVAMVFWVAFVIVLAGQHLKFEYESTKRVRRLAELHRQSDSSQVEA